VQPGDVVLQLSNPSLRSAHQGQAAKVAALEASLFKALPGEGVGAGDARAELAAALAELTRLDERLAALQVRAGAAGRLVLPQAVDLPGRWLRRGSLLGQVITDAPPTVRVAVPESQALYLRREQGAASVRLAGSLQQAHAAQLLGEGGGAGRRLPSAALSARHGGSVLTDPQDKDDLQPLQPVVLLDLRLADWPAEVASRIGERAWVRFDGGLAPLALQAARALQRQAMRQLNPQF
jgi:putative peptide zinc metalloprotease protein